MTCYACNAFNIRELNVFRTLLRDQKVAGSNPVTSTKKGCKSSDLRPFLFALMCGNALYALLHGGKMVVEACYVAVLWHMLSDAQKRPLERFKIYPYNLSG